MTKKTTSSDRPETLVSPGGSSSQQSRPRIRDRRKLSEYEDDDAWNTYEYPPAEELEGLGGASVDELIRWVLNRYEIGSAQGEYLELLEMDQAVVAELRDSLESQHPVSPEERTRYRALVVMSLRDDIRDALKVGDVEEAVIRAVQEILDGELRFKYLRRPVLSILPGRVGPSE
jgi:hypothetical protein